ncbi:universal stress protein [Rhodopila sp.]|jgi:nucleotide-binding universal stress UspA family protein|uniref:universal stress protein n=1 Tax=Rhodopila sp. TaxID=2480087 RepID=UPI002B915565|nr:universal stress protein [Rhodopila sp.]HVZ08759.1 universal stress protein [Rhodopila sp.]
MQPAILVILEKVETAWATLATAALLRQRLAPAASVTVLHIRHDPMEGFMPSEEVMTSRHRHLLQQAADAGSVAIRAVFDHWQASHPDARWTERTGETAAVVRAAVAASDLVVLSRPVAGQTRQALHILLFAARTLTLVAPGSPPPSMGRHAVVAWKDDEPARRVLHQALPLLRRSGAVTLLIGQESPADLTEEPAWLVQALTAADIPVDIRVVPLHGQPIGDVLREQVRAIGADLLVMGAYGHSRLRELILGGATRSVLLDAAVPVLLQH